MNSKVFMATADHLAALGNGLRQARIDRQFEQHTLAERAGISVGALRKLELGRGSTLETFVRVLKALDLESRLDLLLPTPSVSPLALLRARTKGERQRVRRGKDA